MGNSPLIGVDIIAGFMVFLGFGVKKTNKDGYICSYQTMPTIGVFSPTGLSAIRYGQDGHPDYARQPQRTPEMNQCCLNKKDNAERLAAKLVSLSTIVCVYALVRETFFLPTTP
jgi:hypothetical protein